MEYLADDREVEVSKTALVDALKKNREIHTVEIKEAIKGYWEHVDAALATMMEKVKRRDGKVSLLVDLKKPEDHTEDYDLVLHAMEWEVRETVTITLGDFRRFVEDKWTWQREFKFLHMNYTTRGPN